MGIQIKDGEFVDEHGRVVNLRGVNVGGSSKLPTNTKNLDKSATFINRPFPLADAPLHFTRLRACGFNIIRFIVTWEAIEHEGPGIYDYEYIQYIRSILEKANEFGIYVYIDPHQDVWSRWTGGDGAPLWTLEKVGFNVTNFRECEAVICQNSFGKGHSTAERKGKSFPKMIWPTNYFKLACSTMFTLFFAGERFAPHFMVDDDDSSSANDDKKINIQTYLQRHYINAMAELLKHLNGLENIVGIGTMNEPSSGYINVDDLSKGYRQSGSSSSGTGSKELMYGLAPTPFQGMCLGEGHAQTVGDYSHGFKQHVLGKPDHWITVDPKGKRVWKSSDGDENGSGCIWKQAGVWKLEGSQPELLLPNYFASVDFGRDCYLPFATEYANTLRSMWTSNNKLLIFVELPPLEFSSTPFPDISPSALPDAVNATHWYDGITLFTRSWKSYCSVDTRTHRPVLGYNNISKMHVSQLGEIKQLGVEKMDGAPTLIGECGIPYDMIETMYMKLSRSTIGGNTIIDFRDNSSPQFMAMNHTVRCLEKNLLSFTLWCYTPDNTNKEGDGWNGEDLSIYSEDQKCGLNETDPYYIYDGLRSAGAFVRPYAQSIAGMPLVNEFDLNKGKYRLVYKNNGKKKYDVPTVIFVPKLWCLKESDMCINVSDGRTEVTEDLHWFIVMYYGTTNSVKHKVEISK